MFLGGETMLLFGHRGYSDQYPENTMLAFEKAIELGVPRPELQDKLKASK